MFLQGGSHNLAAQGLAQSELKASWTVRSEGFRAACAVQMDPSPQLALTRPEKNCVSHCSYAFVTQTSKLIAESLNVLIGKAEMQ